MAMTRKPPNPPAAPVQQVRTFDLPPFPTPAPEAQNPYPTAESYSLLNPSILCYWISAQSYVVSTGFLMDLVLMIAESMMGYVALSSRGSWRVEVTLITEIHCRDMKLNLDVAVIYWWCRPKESDDLMLVPDDENVVLLKLDSQLAGAALLGITCWFSSLLSEYLLLLQLIGPGAMLLLILLYFLLTRWMCVLVCGAMYHGDV
ncbi:hypothetical protein Nepgr_025355 [Nepenthes gracilis]|uniref:Uncharacterized protein n=1 Tax=Nepenthes gracilis TaxID=150966 RepID=A0AAD3T6A3_NEPGR|nr:hypothetical protein Nepgr_025355 [Nepenthes gracilis]